MTKKERNVVEGYNLYLRDIDKISSLRCSLSNYITFMREYGKVVMENGEDIKSAEKNLLLNALNFVNAVNKIAELEKSFEVTPSKYIYCEINIKEVK